MDPHREPRPLLGTAMLVATLDQLLIAIVLL
jgi:hypothetical protein